MLNKKNLKRKNQRKRGRLNRLLPTTLIQQPQLYGSGSAIATFENEYTSDGNLKTIPLSDVISTGNQVPTAYFISYKYFKIISVVVSISPSAAPGIAAANLVWSGNFIPNVLEDDSSKRVPISTNKINNIIFVPPKILTTYSYSTLILNLNLGQYSSTQNVILNGLPILPGKLFVTSPNGAKFTVYIKFDFRGQTTAYYDKP